MDSDEYESMWNALGRATVMIWFCPDRRDHERKRGRNAPLRPTVEWVGNVAHCLEPGCGNKSTDEKEKPMDEKTLVQMTDEVREINTEKGWRDPGKTYGDFIALLHTEVGEMTDAFRVWGLKDGTREDGKPEGVGSELADVFIRLLDTCDVVGVRVYGDIMDYGATLKTVGALDLHGRGRGRGGNISPGPLISFGDHASLLHRMIDRMWDNAEDGFDLLLAINLVARKYDIDLVAEYERKQAFNRTREYRHGGKSL